MTVLHFERFPVDANRVDDFERLVGNTLELMRSAGGCLWADGAKALDDEPSYIVLSEWRCEADLEAWAVGAEAAAFLDDVDVLLRGDSTDRRFTGT